MISTRKPDPFLYFPWNTDPQLLEIITIPTICCGNNLKKIEVLNKSVVV